MRLLNITLHISRFVNFGTTLFFASLNAFRWYRNWLRDETKKNTVDVQRTNMTTETKLTVSDDIVKGIINHGFTQRLCFCLDNNMEDTFSMCSKYAVFDNNMQSSILIYQQRKNEIQKKIRKISA